MEDLSLKAKILLKILEILKADSYDNRVNVYQIMNKLEDLDIEKLFPGEDEDEIYNVKFEMNQKSIGTSLSSLHRKHLIAKVAPGAFNIEGKMKNLVSYYLV